MTIAIQVMSVQLVKSIHLFSAISIWLIIHNNPADAYGGGAPDTTCDSMIPGHPQPGDIGPPPYEILPSQSSFRPGEKINITIRGTNGETFRGFLLQARRSVTDTEKIGSFTILDDSTARQNCLAECTKWADCSITHKDGSDKSSLNFIWTAPCSEHGDVTFVATFVRTRIPSAYWHSLPLANLTAAPPNGDECQQTSTLPTVPPTMTPLPPTDLADCGLKKGCYRSPSDCAGETDCDHLLTWVYDNDRVEFNISAKVSSTEQWTALGLSLNQKMGSDSVTDCIYDESSHAVIIQSSWNDDSPNNIVLSDKQLGLVPGSTKGSYSNGILQCQFTRFVKNNQTTFNSEYFSGPSIGLMSLKADNIYDIDQPFYLFLASGPGSAGVKFKHTALPAISPEQVTLNSDNYKNIGGMNKFPLVITHGTMMILAWMLFASLGVLMPRYFKTAWRDVTWYDKAIWFQIHRPVMSLVLILTCCGFIVIFVEEGGYSKGLSNADAAHPVLGIIVTVLVIVNPLMAIFRPGPNAPNRPIFNAAHFTVGTVAHVTSAVTMFLGTRLSKARMSDWAQWIVVGFALWHTVVEIILAAHQWHMQKGIENNKIADTKQASVEVNNGSSGDYTPKGSITANESSIDLVDGSVSIAEREFSGSVTKTVIIMVHCLALLGCAISLVVDLAT